MQVMQVNIDENLHNSMEKSRGMWVIRHSCMGSGERFNKIWEGNSHGRAENKIYHNRCKRNIDE
jgi:hypothetical protein